jgi:hypothetical protein
MPDVRGMAVPWFWPLQRRSRALLDSNVDLARRQVNDLVAFLIFASLEQSLETNADLVRR